MITIKSLLEKKENNHEQVELIYFFLKLSCKPDMYCLIPYLGSDHNHQTWLNNCAQDLRSTGAGRRVIVPHSEGKI